MPILKNRCPSALICNSSECQHKRDHEANEFCQAGCKWSKLSMCQSDLKGYIDSVLCDFNYMPSTNSTRGSLITQNDALDLIMAAVKEEYEK